jgi:hypothetical protein
LTVTVLRPSRLNTVRSALAFDASGCEAVSKGIGMFDRLAVEADDDVTRPQARKRRRAILSHIGNQRTACAFKPQSLGNVRRHTGEGAPI